VVFRDLLAQAFSGAPLHAAIKAKHRRAFGAVTTSTNGFILVQGCVVMESRLLFPRTY
jgi:hypothetical protein